MRDLRNNSDVDVLVIVNHRLSEATRRNLSDRLMLISGKIGNEDSVCPLEITVINHNDVAPWKYPPRKEFIYGEWLRGKFEQGQIPEPTYDPDLAILLYQVRYNSISLVGHAASKTIDPVPMRDVRRAMKDNLPSLLDSIKGDERNVILTLARMRVTAAIGEFLPKDIAVERAISRLPEEQAALLNLAGKA